MAAKASKALKPHFYRIELNKTEWELPDRYQKLNPVGSGAYGQVWYVYIPQVYLNYDPFVTLLFIVCETVKKVCNI